MNIADFTLIPIGGLGNRLRAICSAIVYCKEHNKSLEIIWFKDKGLNCPYDKLFSLSPKSTLVSIKNPSFTDYLLKDHPRKKNLWIPELFQYMLFDKRIYMKELVSYPSNEYLLKQDLSSYNNIYMVSCGIYWKNDEMWTYIQPNSAIETKVDTLIREMKSNVVGIHIRRTDCEESIMHCPRNLFEDSIDKEILNDRDVTFYLASDSLEEKKYFKEKYGDRIVTSLHESRRDTPEGIQEAFMELLILSKTKKIYAGYSSFADLASSMTGVERILVTNKSM